MNRILASVAAVALTIALAPAVAAPQRDATAAQAVIARQIEAEVAKVADAYRANNYARYFSFFDDDILIWAGSRGRWTKQDYVNLWSKRIGEGGGVVSLSIDDLQLRISPTGDAAVATFFMPVVNRAPGVTAQPNAKPDLTYNMTEVWFNHKGRWSMSHMYWTVVPK